MNGILEALQSLVYWHWWAFGVVLVILEMLLPGTVLLWMGISAGVVGAILLVAPDVTIQMQLLIWAVLSVATILAFRVWQKRNPTESADPLLNRRGAQYVDRVFVLDRPLTAGQGRIKVDDTEWQARGRPGETIPSGTSVRVTGVEGATLLVEPLGEQA